MDRDEVNTAEVHAALEILLKEIQAVINSLHAAGSRALQMGSYGEANRIIELAKRVADFREKIKTLQKEWETLLAPSAPIQPDNRRHHRREKLRHGLMTPRKTFRRPILEALVELGGRASVTEVLKIVERKMKAVLNSYDMQFLPSGQIRWQKTAQWCRYQLVQEGLLKDNSPPGIWEISERGREALQKGDV